MNENDKARLTPVFWIALAMVTVLVLYGVLFSENFETVTGNLQGFITSNFSWYYVSLTTVFIAFCLVFVLTPMGQIRLGKPTEKPEFRTLSWFAMLFSAGMGIGLVFWGAAEPLSHFFTPPTAEPGTDEAMKESLRRSFFHWGFHAWAIYAVVGLALAFTQFRRNEPGLISRTLRPILGKRVEGPVGTAIDVIAVFATVAGVATSLGLGVKQINGGLHYLFNVPNNITVQIMIIIVITVLFMYSSWTGLSKGIQYLSNANMILAGLLMIFTLVVGPTVLILNMWTDTFGGMIGSFVQMSYDVAPLNQDKNDWLGSWTIYYWGWWMSWSPFVGIFIARVSRGRTIREFVLAVMIAPAAVSFVWFSIFGVTAINMEKTIGGFSDLATEIVLFEMLNNMPMGLIISIVAVLLIATFFITSADSATFVLGMQTTNGSLTPPNKVKLIWGAAQVLIAIVLLMGGGLDALQAAAIISAFPFSIILILMMIATYKDVAKEQKALNLLHEPNYEGTKYEKLMKDHEKKLERENSEKSE
ncbi:BCCT family transporter [Salinicoccus hispanicus]|uniref:BCCT family transporter n=1 Tax=Salinicoccus hispanicus TaxID=157225 RepID=A0A6N8U1X6_9STAP|nr:BCCT family transporter [Salinicoccus hispanicus]MXQ50365.1 BCCT family transporter [Salinicoccus hispanicus]